MFRPQQLISGLLFQVVIVTHLQDLVWGADNKCQEKEKKQITKLQFVVRRNCNFRAFGK